MNDTAPSKRPLESNENGRPARFTRRGLMALGIAVALFVWFAIDLLLLLFAGLLFGIFLSSLADQLSARSRLGHSVSLGIVCLVLVAAGTGAGMLFAGQLSEQARGLSERLPEATRTVMAHLEEWEWSRWLVEQVRGPGAAVVNGEAAAQSEVVARATNAASRLVDGLVAVVIVLFVGVYLAAAPGHYVRGVLRLVPIRRRERVGEVIYAVGYTLRWWLFGQLLAMVAVGVTMGVGLALIGVPLAAGLGVVAGLFEFIPTIGPMLAVVPALLIALVDSPEKAFWVVVLYSVVQTLESYLLTPLLQQRVVHLPPVLTIATQVLLAWRLGPMGLLVAVPLIAVAMVAVQMLYVQDVLTDRFELTAEQEGRRELEASGHLESLL
jgi:predicted PurR-regulated permease PerM